MKTESDSNYRKLALSLTTRRAVVAVGDKFDVCVDGQKVSRGLIRSELRAYGWDEEYSLRNDLDTFAADFAGHIKRVDSATKLTQSQPDSQLKRAKKVFDLYQEFRDALEAYGYSDVKKDGDG